MKELFPFRVEKPVQKVRAATERAFYDFDTERDTGWAWSVLANSESGPFHKTKALMTVLRSVIPDSVFNTLTRGKYVFSQEAVTVFDPNLYELEPKILGQGAQAVTYRVFSRDPDIASLVLKISRSLEEQSYTELLEVGASLQREHTINTKRYQEVEGFVLPQMQFVGTNPRGKKLALFTIQEYAGSKDEIRDFFREISEEELFDLIDKDEEFRIAVEAFIRITLQYIESDRQIIDTLGNKNVVVSTRIGKPKIILLDPYNIVDLGEVKNEWREKALIDKEYLEKIARYIKSLSRIEATIE